MATLEELRQAIEKEGHGPNARLKDSGTKQPVSFAGALPRDSAVSTPERHLGLTMPLEQQNSASPK